MTTCPRIIITPGEPSGIGPEIVIKIAQEKWPAELIVVCDKALLLAHAKLLNIPLTLINCDLKTPATMHKPGELKIIPVALESDSEPGKLNRSNAKYVIKCLELATDLCLDNRAQALVTGPIHKGVINDADIKFTGHTEFLAKRCKVSDVIMLFVTDKMKVAIATTHIALAQVPKAITTNKLKNMLNLLYSEVKKHFNIHDPKIMVCGLNPHSGEGGHLGWEEIDVIEPALQSLRADKMHIIGPLPADTVFTQKHLSQADVVLAMYHDQALPVIKYAEFGHAVNLTLGLPIIRTSVDHGTALNIAGQNQADPGSMAAALALAIKLVK